MSGGGLLRMWLQDHAHHIRTLESTARNAFSPGTALDTACRALADCHAAAALIYETALSTIGEEQ